MDEASMDDLSFSAQSLVIPGTCIPLVVKLCSYALNAIFSRRKQEAGEKRRAEEQENVV